MSGANKHIFWRQKGENNYISTLRLTKADKDKIRLPAEKAGLTITDYLVRCGSGRKIVVMDGLKELAAEVKAFGRNLNQLTILANIGRIDAVNLSEFADAFRRVNDQLFEIAGKLR